MLMELEWKMWKTENGLTRTGTDFQCEKYSDGNETREKKECHFTENIHENCILCLVNCFEFSIDFHSFFCFLSIENFIDSHIEIVLTRFLIFNTCVSI